MRKPTIVMLECFPFPEYKPEHDGVYLVQYDKQSPWTDSVSTLSWKGEDWIFDGDKVIAWAEMPESLVE